MLLVILFTVMIPKTANGAENDFEESSVKTQLSNGTINYGMPIHFTTNPDYPGVININGLYVYKEGKDYIFTLLYSNGELVTFYDEQGNEKVKTSFFNPPEGDILMISYLNNSEHISSDNQKIQYRVDAKLLQSVPDSITIFLYDKIFNNEYENISCYFKISDLNFKESSKPQKLYTIKFNSNGGSEVNSILNVPKYSTITLPENPTKDGFIFKGWFTDKKTFIDEFTESSVVDENLTLYAKWDQVIIEQINGNARSVEIEFNVIPDVVLPSDFIITYTIDNVTKTFTSDEMTIELVDKENNAVWFLVPKIFNRDIIYGVTYRNLPEVTTQMTAVDDFTITKNADSTYTIRGYAYNVDEVRIGYYEFEDPFSKPVFTLTEDDMELVDVNDPYCYRYEVIDNIPTGMNFVYVSSVIFVRDGRAIGNYLSQPIPVVTAIE